MEVTFRVDESGGGEDVEMGMKDEVVSERLDSGDGSE